MVKIVQLLCPSRHCIIASVFEDTKADFKEACRQMWERMKQLGVGDHCA